MIKKYISAALVLLVLTSAQSAEWEIDKSHTEVGFTATHMVITKVNGKFNDFTGEINFDPENPASSKIKGVVQVASVDTDNEKRDQHLRTSEFFDAENHPELVFESKKISKTADGYVAVGDLTMRGVTKEVELPFTVVGPINDPWGNTRVGIEGRAAINRMDWGISWNNVMDSGGLVVSEDIVIRLDAQLIKK